MAFNLLDSNALKTFVSSFSVNARKVYILKPKCISLDAEMYFSWCRKRAGEIIGEAKQKQSGVRGWHRDVQHNHEQ